MSNVPLYIPRELLDVLLVPNRSNSFVDNTSELRISLAFSVCIVEYLQKKIWHAVI